MSGLPPSLWRAPELPRISLQRRGMEVAPQKLVKMKNFMALKDKIVKTDELILRYQARARECEQYKERLATLEQGNTGLRAELQALHKEKERLELSILSMQKRLVKLEEKKAVDEVVIQQLTAQVEELRAERIPECERSQREMKIEKDKWMRQYQTLKRQFEAYKQAHARGALRPVRHRRTSDASTCSLATVSSPGYLPVFQSSPISTFSLPDTMEECAPLDDLLSSEPTSSKNDKVTNQEELLAPEQYNRTLTLHPCNGSIEGQYPPPSPTAVVSPPDPSTPHIFPSEPPNTTVTPPDGANPQLIDTGGLPGNSPGPPAHDEQEVMSAECLPAAGSGEVDSDDDDALSVSDSSSMCSDSSLDDLANLLNTSQEGTEKISSILPLPINAPATQTPAVESSSVLPPPPNVPATQTPAAINPSSSSPLVLAHGNSEQDGTLLESSYEEWEPSALEEELWPPTVTAAPLPAPVEPHPAPAQSDSGDSEGSSADETEFNSFLSPPPHQSLQLLSPLPPTPRDTHQISLLSPPLTLREPVVSPLPRTPHSHEDNTQLLSAPLPQFGDSVPVGLHTPRPYLVHSATNINPITPRLVQKQLKLSESSPFSPPFDSSLTLEACLSVSQSGTAFEATSLELCCETRKEMKPVEMLARKKRGRSPVEGEGGEARDNLVGESDSSVQAQENKTTSGQEKCGEVPTLANECDIRSTESSTKQPSTGNSSSADNTTIETKTFSENVTFLVSPLACDSDTEEGEIVDSSEEEEEQTIFNSEGGGGKVEKKVDSKMEKEEGEVVDSRMEKEEEEVVDSKMEKEEGEIVDSKMEKEEGEIVDSKMEKEEGEIVDSKMEKEEGEIVDSKMEKEEGEIVDSKMEKEEGEIVDSRMEKEEGEIVDSRMEKEEGEIVDSRMEKEEGEIVDSRMEKEEGEIVDSKMEEEEGEIVDSKMEEEEGEVVDEEGELADSDRREKVGIERTPEEWETEDQMSAGSESFGLGEQKGARKGRRNRQRRGRMNLVQTKGMELRVTPLPLLQSSGNRPGVGEKRVGCKTAHPSPRKKQRVEEPPSCLSPPSLEATPEHILPGYRLRSRRVDFWEMAPKRRSSSDGKEDTPPQKMQKVTPPEAVSSSNSLPVVDAPPASGVRTRRNSGSLPVIDAPPVSGVRTRRNSGSLPVIDAPPVSGVHTRRNSGNLPVIDAPPVSGVRTRRNSGNLPVIDAPPVSGVRTRRNSGNLPVIDAPPVSGVRTRRNSGNLPVIDTLPTSGVRTRRNSGNLPVVNTPPASRIQATSKSGSLPVMDAPPTSSVQTRKNLGNLSDTPAASGIRTRRNSGSLPVTDTPPAAASGVQSKKSSVTLPKDDATPSLVQEAKEGVAVPWAGFVGGDGVGVASGKQVRQTDGATGQEEDKTPAGSPQNARDKRPGATQQIIGDLQLPFSPSTSQHTAPPQPLPQPSAPVFSPTSPASLSTPSLVQQQLMVCMQCPLPLPPWLVNAMSKVQSCGAHNPAPSNMLKNKKRGNPREIITRQQKQLPFHYAVVNLERLMCGHLFLSPVIAMFSDPWNIPSLANFVKATMEYLTKYYNPNFEQVASVYHQLCNNTRANPQQLDPLDPAFPPALLRPECQFIALFAHICRTNKTMVHLLPEITQALHQAIMSQGIKFHRLAAMCRLFAAMCRLQGEPERVLFLCFDLVRKPLRANEIPVIPGITSIWPGALSRKKEVKLLERGKQILPRGLEQQPLTYTLEVIVLSMFKKCGEKAHESLIKNMHTLCKWNPSPSPNLANSLVPALLELLKNSPQVYIDSSPPGQLPWRRPRPSTLAFHLVHCLRALTWYQGWVWTNDTLIGAHLWPVLQQWNSSADNVREPTIVCILRLIGFVGQQGVTQDPQSSSVMQLQRVLIALLRQKNSTKEVSLPIQLAAADSLLELCPPHHPAAKEAVAAINTWLKAHCRHPAGMVLAQEFNSRLQSYLHITNI